MRRRGWNLSWAAFFPAQFYLWCYSGSAPSLRPYRRQKFDSTCEWVYTSLFIVLRSLVCSGSYYYGGAQVDVSAVGGVERTLAPIKDWLCQSVKFERCCYHLSSLDLFQAIWLFAFLATCVLDVTLGLAACVLFSLLTVIYRSQRWYTANRTIDRYASPLIR